MTAFTFQLALLFFPGIICGLIVEQLAVQGKWDAFRFVLYCFILGLASYLLYALVTNAWYCRWPTRLPLIHSVRHPKHIIFGDVLWATVAAVPLAFFDYPRRQSRLASLARAEGPREQQILRRRRLGLPLQHPDGRDEVGHRPELSGIPVTAQLAESEA